MSWVFLLLAGCMEIFGVMMMSKFVATHQKIFLFGLFCFMGVSFALLSLAMQEISMGTAYAIWTGIGAGGGVIVGSLFLGESRSARKFICVGVIVLCSVGLKLVAH